MEVRTQGICKLNISEMIYPIFFFFSPDDLMKKVEQSYLNFESFDSLNSTPYFQCRQIGIVNQSPLTNLRARF